jgi:hypothetical protein
METVGKAELVERLKRESRRLDDVIGRLDRNVRIGAWSLTDFLAHLIAHEQRAMAEVQAALRGEPFLIDHGANDAFNQGATFSNRLYPFNTVYRAWLESYASVLEFVNALPDDVFHAPNSVTQILSDTIDGALANNTYAHYAEHLPRLIALLEA